MERATYRVYTARDLSSIPPSTLKSHTPRRNGLGWSGFFFLVMIGTMIGGSSYAALRVVKPDAPRVTTAFGIQHEEPKAAAPVVAATPPPAEVVVEKPVAIAPAAPSAKTVASAPKAAPPAPLVVKRPAAIFVKAPAAKPPTTANTTANAPPALPPNPFDDPS